MKINSQDLELLVNSLKANDLQEVEYQDNEYRIRLVGHTSALPSNANSFLSSENNFGNQTTTSKQATESSILDAKESVPAPSSKNTMEIKSSLIGNFYLTKSPDNPPLVKVGDEIKKGQVIAVVEAMKLIHEFKSEIDGTIVAIPVESGQFVDLDTVIFEVEPKE